MADQTKTGIIGTIVIAAIGVVGPIIRRKIEEEMKALEAKAIGTQSWGDDAAVKLANILMAVDE